MKNVLSLDGRVDGNHLYFRRHLRAPICPAHSMWSHYGSGGDYHLASLPRCDPGIAQGLAKTDLGDELLAEAQSLTHAELSMA